MYSGFRSFIRSMFCIHFSPDLWLVFLDFVSWILMKCNFQFFNGLYFGYFIEEIFVMKWMLPKLIHRVNKIWVDILIGSFVGFVKLVLNYTCKGKGHRIEKQLWTRTKLKAFDYWKSRYTVSPDYWRQCCVCMRMTQKSMEYWSMEGEGINQSTVWHGWQCGDGRRAGEAEAAGAGKRGKQSCL